MAQLYNHQNIVVLIMAGGKGERFWPRSRISTPKQLQKVYSDKTLLKETIDRALTVTSLNRIFIGTNSSLKKSILAQETYFPTENFIIEPEGKNTAPIIALSSLYFKKKFNNPIQIVLSADAFITPIKEFTKTILQAINTAREENLVLLGIKPNRPETGYGYISSKKSTGKSLEVKAFYEKPDFTKASAYIKDKNMYWNPGIFIWQTETILAEFTKYAPEILTPIQSAFAKKGNAEMKKIFNQLKSEAIDTSIMEKSSKIRMVPASFQWDDVGSWLSMERITNADKNDNHLVGKNAFFHKSKGNIAITKKEMIALLNVNNLIIVEEEDILFISTKDGVDDIKELLAELKKNKSLQKYLR